MEDQARTLAGMSADCFDQDQARCGMPMQDSSKYALGPLDDCRKTEVGGGGDDQRNKEDEKGEGSVDIGTGNCESGVRLDRQ